MLNCVFWRHIPLEIEFKVVAQTMHSGVTHERCADFRHGKKTETERNRNALYFVKLLNVPSFLLDEAGCLGACNRQLRINRKIGKFQISKHEGGWGGAVSFTTNSKMACVRNFNAQK